MNEGAVFLTALLCQFRWAVLILRFRQQTIHLREKNIVGPTERSRRQLADCASSQGRTNVFR